mmetsp:Transcript_3704/g.9408  ORF Transcript_3704/g.9408 Transcript_3704/m.9408 type:complete len:500 (-) Transcript_3704:365-1864(-)
MMSSSESESYSDDGESSDDSHVSITTAPHDLGHFLLHFCDGGYDDDIRAELNSFRDTTYAINASGNNSRRYHQARWGSSPDNWDEMEAMGQRNLEGRLRDITDEIRTIGSSAIKGGKVVVGNMNLAIHREPRTDIDNDPSAIIWKDIPISHNGRLLDPCWEGFSVALAQHGNVSFSIVTICNIKLAESVLGLLATSLGGRVEHSLQLINNDLFCNEDSIISLMALVEGNPTLCDISLCNNPITNSSNNTAVMSLFRAIEAQTALCTMSLTSCSIGDNISVLSRAIRCVKEIYLNGNDIGSQGAVAISEYLQTNPHLEQLDIEHNNLNDNDAILLSKALRKNSNLQGIWLRGNNFSVAGVKAMFKAVFDSSSMNTISESNHGCSLSLFSTTEPIQGKYLDFINCKDRSVERITKMMTALFHSRESLLRHLSITLLEFMPHVISLIQGSEGNELKPLDKVYAIMRWWDMPSLYTCRRSCFPPESDKKRKRVLSAEEDPSRT